jgi:hypothetical protein
LAIIGHRIGDEISINFGNRLTYIGSTLCPIAIYNVMTNTVRNIVLDFPKKLCQFLFANLQFAISVGSSGFNRLL